MPKCEKTKFTVAKTTVKIKKVYQNKENGIFFRVFAI